MAVYRKLKRDKSDTGILNVRMGLDLRRALKVYASQRGTTITTLINGAIWNMLPRSMRPKDSIAAQAAQVHSTAMKQ